MADQPRESNLSTRVRKITQALSQDLTSDLRDSRWPFAKSAVKLYSSVRGPFALMGMLGVWLLVAMKLITLTLISDLSQFISGQNDNENF